MDMKKCAPREVVLTYDPTDGRCADRVMFYNSATKSVVPYMRSTTEVQADRVGLPLVSADGKTWCRFFINTTLFNQLDANWYDAIQVEGIAVMSCARTSSKGNRYEQIKLDRNDFDIRVVERREVKRPLPKAVPPHEPTADDKMGEV